MHEFERESKRGGYMEGIAEKTGRGNTMWLCFNWTNKINKMKGNNKKLVCDSSTSVALSSEDFKNVS